LKRFWFTLLVLMNGLCVKETKLVLIEDSVMYDHGIH